MKKNTRILLIAAATLLIAAAIVCGVLLVLDITGSNRPADTEEPPKETIHEEEERRYNEDGKLSKIIYYKDDVLQGSTDYVYMDNYVCIIYFDENNQQTGYEQTYENTLGNPTRYVKQERDTLVKSIEYDYYEDLATLKKVTTKMYEDGVEYAVKEYYDGNGKLTRKCTYEDGVLQEDITYTYDEAGELVSSGSTASEDTVHE